MTIQIETKPSYTVHHYDGVLDIGDESYNFDVIDDECDLWVQWGEDGAPISDKEELKQLENQIIEKHKSQI